MAQITIIYFSGYRHTAKHVRAIEEGAARVEVTKVTHVEIDKDGNLPDNCFTTLKNSDAIIFGSPTYMA